MLACHVLFAVCLGAPSGLEDLPSQPGRASTIAPRPPLVPLSSTYRSCGLPISHPRRVFSRSGCASGSAQGGHAVLLSWLCPTDVPRSPSPLSVAVPFPVILSHLFVPRPVHSTASLAAFTALGSGCVPGCVGICACVALSDCLFQLFARCSLNHAEFVSHARRWHRNDAGSKLHSSMR
ncbi:hypothetical protein B0H21DRAFT_290047 [Amylocystis lapponica]|nr:hypothetical protein B0H21DRAFT_290047 [Amylocystis lapponica]